MHKSTKLSRITVATLLFFGMAFYIARTPHISTAAVGSDFKAGRIIDDSIFYTGGELTTQQIQSFLESKVPICDTNGIKPYGGTTRALYGTSKNNPPPFTCLRDYSNTYDAREGNELCLAIPAGLKTAAQVIYDVSNACGVSARALIVLLEKEQGLVTDDWPWTVQYRSATGYGCPDTAPCDTQYYGFYNQVYNAARQFKNYAANPTWFRYKPYQNNTILYNPNTACGSSTVYIENKATAALYNYTPYQPNTAALGNLYGIGDSCSAYGNRNFWRLFTDWFGTTITGKDGMQLFTIAHPAGSLVRALNGGPIYKIIDGYRLPVSSYTAFLSWGYKDSDVKILNRGDEQLPISTELLGYRSGVIVQEAGDVKINAIECSSQFYSSCSKRHISTYETFVGLGYQISKDVLKYPSNELQGLSIGTPITSTNLHPDGTLIQDRDTNKVFILRNQTLYHIPSYWTFVVNHFNWTKIKPMTNYEYTTTIKTTDLFVYDTNLLVRSISGPAIYSVGENGWGTIYKRHIVSFNTFLQLGYTDSDVSLMESNILDNIVSIDPVQ